MVTVRTAKWCGAMLLLAGLGACRGEPSDAVRTGSAFCDSVQPRVEAYLDQAAREHPVSEQDTRYGGTVTVGGVAELTGGLNPAVSQSYNGQQYENYVLLMPLVRLDENLHPAPYLARSWDVSPDSTRLTFHLRTDVVWHDGVPTDAEDVAFTFRTVTNPETGFPNPAYWDRYDQGPDGVEVVDDSTVTFRMTKHADFLDPWRATAIIPAHLLRNVPPSEMATHPYSTECPVGNGPFAFVEHRVNDRWIFRADPAFPTDLGGRPYLDYLVHRIIPEQATLLSELLTGGIQVYVSAPPDQVARMEASPDVDALAFQHREITVVAWNSRRPQLADRRVRMALTLGTDREGIVQSLLHGYGTVANTLVPPIFWQYHPEVLPDVHFNPDSARALLDAAGWQDRNGDGVRENDSGVPLEISLKYNTGNRLRQSIAELMQAQLADIGVSVRVESVDAETLGDQIFTPARDFDGVLTSWVQDFKIDDRDLLDSERIDGFWALTGMQNPALDQILDTLQTVVDRKAALPLWDEYQRMFIQEQPYTVLFFARRIAGVRKSVHDVHVDPRSDWVSVHDWWLDPAQR